MKPGDTPGGRMAEVRKKMGWSQDDLAEEAGVSKTTVSRLERNLIRPDQPIMRRCLEAMKLTPEVVELIINPQTTGTTMGQKGPAVPADMDLLRREMDVLMRQYPMLDMSTRSIIMSVLWMGMRRMKGEEHDLTAITAPLPQEWNRRILDMIENPDPDWKAALDLVDQTASEDAPKHTEVPATQTEVTPEQTKVPAARTETPSDNPKAAVPRRKPRPSVRRLPP